MRKNNILLLFLCLTLAFGLIACGKGEANQTGGNETSFTEESLSEERTDTAKPETGEEAMPGSQEETGAATGTKPDPAPDPAKESTGETDAPAEAASHPEPEEREPALGLDVAMTQYLIRRQTFQRGQAAVGDSYDAVYCFLADHTFYWFAPQGSPKELPADQRDCRLKYGQWQVKEGQLLLKVEVMDCYENGFWALDNFSNTYAYEGGQARRYDGQSSTETLTEQYRIAEGQGFVDIGGEPYYASDLPLKENDALFERLKEWISQPLEPGESIPDLRELELLAAKEPDPFASSLSFSNDPEVIGTKGTPQELPKGLEILTAAPAAEAGNWSYALGEALYNGRHYLLIWRQNAGGEQQWIANTLQPMSGFHQIQYTSGSLEASGQRYLYFTLQNGNSQQKSLWCFNLETEYFAEILPEPCSNLLIPTAPPADLEGLGWIVYDHYIAAIDLDQGTTYEGMTLDNAQAQLFPEIGNSFFAPDRDFGLIRQTCLEDLGQGTLEVQFLTWDPAWPKAQARDVYRYNCLSQEAEHLRSVNGWEENSSKTQEALPEEEPSQAF